MIKRLVLAMAVFLMLTGTVAAGPVILKWGSWEPTVGWGNKNVWISWIKEANKIDPDTLQFKFFPGGTLGKNPFSYVKLVRDGVMDIGLIPNTYHPGIFPDDQVLSIPFLAKTSYEACIAIWRLYENGMLRGYEDYVPLAIYMSTPYMLTTTFPVSKPADLKGKKIRAGGRLQFKLIEALGATPVPLPITKSAEGLSRGVIQGALASPNLVETFRLSSVAKYHLVLPFGVTNGMQAMSKKGYDRLPDKAKAFLKQHTGEKIQKIWGKRNDASHHKILSKLQKDPKHTVFIPTPEQTKEWMAVIKPFIEAWKKEDPKNEEVYNACMEELVKLR